MNFLKNTTLALFTILILTVICFFPMFHNGFVNWDDPAYVLQNPYVLTLNIPTIIKSFQTSVEHTYVPLTNLSWAIEHALFGFNAFMFHWNNLLIHLANVVLVFLLARQFGVHPRGALLSAFLFAVHPMHVEPVAWVTERKGLLSAFFYLLAMRFYIFYIEDKNWRNYGFAVVAGLFSILAKPMGYSLPIVFFILDWFFKRPINLKSFFDKLLPIVIVLFFSKLTFTKDFLSTPYPISEMILIWIWSLSFYLTKFLIPIALSPLYSLPQPISWQNQEYWLSIAIVFLFSLIAIRLRKERLGMLAILFFFTTIGALILRTGWQFGNFTVVADRFMYLPSLGFCFLAGSAVIKVFVRANDLNHQKLISWAVVAVLLNFSLMTIKQTQTWKSSLTLWDHALKLSPHQSLAYVNRADYYRQTGNVHSAEKDLENAIYFDQGSFMAYHLLGIVKADQSQLKEALAAFDQAHEFNPEFKDVYLNRGNALLRMGKYDKALEDFNRYLELAPTAYQGYTYRGIAHDMRKESDLALADFNRALEIYPDYVEGLTNRGTFYAIQKNYEAALKDFEYALKLDPNNAALLTNRDKVLENLKLNPNN